MKKVTRIEKTAAQKQVWDAVRLAASRVPEKTVKVAPPKRHQNTEKRESSEQSG